MPKQGQQLISELKTLVLETVQGFEECHPGKSGVTYRQIQDVAELDLELPAHNGWLTWSILSALCEDGLIESEKRGRYLYWKLAAAGKK